MLKRHNSLSFFIKLHPITFSIILIHFSFYLYLQIPFVPHQPFLKTLIGINLNISEGEWWRLFTPMFIHLHFAHFFYNTLSLAVMGCFIESFLGKWKLVLLYICSGFAGNTATFLLLPLSYTHTGSSGSIFGLLGCFLLFTLQNKLFLSKQNRAILFLIMIITVFMTNFEENVNITAHIAGFTAGILFGWIFSKNESINKNFLF
ncbi:rhomboid family intramembrane serine protease [Bacillus sp. FJAT-49736]|uniref:rhomboid family intramembrane serine protease n=1 Tax=Bacillus sp. FJAT-49736 TaxID=2833582 RepID=UPI001BC8F832|nr:rhomboid family intramembrane serine protease [Bacillus sp. FJAT-49736]MBS4175484.1 rhomboid family intramembrane serine protease [Bacillus sp. FJAT-49736]